MSGQLSGWDGSLSSIYTGSDFNVRCSLYVCKCPCLFVEFFPLSPPDLISLTASCWAVVDTAPPDDKYSKWVSFSFVGHSVQDLSYTLLDTTWAIQWKISRFQWTLWDEWAVSVLTVDTVLILTSTGVEPTSSLTDSCSYDPLAFLGVIMTAASMSDL